MSTTINNILNEAVIECNTAKIIELINKIDQLKCEINSNNKSAKTTADLLFEMDACCLELSLSLKKKIQNETTINTVLNKDEAIISDEERKQLYEKMILENNIVDIQYNNNILIVHTPYIFRRAFGKDYTYRNFQMANYVALALIKWAKDNKKECENIGGIPYLNNEMSSKISVIVTRFSKEFNRSIICDNDNIETGRIINIVCEFISRNDNASNMDFVSRYRQTNDEKMWGTEFKFVPTEKLKEYI